MDVARVTADTQALSPAAQKFLVSLVAVLIVALMGEVAVANPVVAAVVLGLSGFANGPVRAVVEPMFKMIDRNDNADDDETPSEETGS